MESNIGCWRMGAYYPGDTHYIGDVFRPRALDRSTDFGIVGDCNVYSGKEV